MDRRSIPRLVEVDAMLQDSVRGGRDSIFDLIELIYSAVSDAALWPVVLEGISDAMQGEQTLFFSPLQKPGEAPALCSRGTAPEVLPGYLDYYHSVNPLDQPCNRMFQDGTTRYSHWAVPDCEFERTEFYSDFFRPLKMYYSCGVKIPLSCGSPAYLATQRAKARGPYGQNEGGVLQILMPHLQRALTLHVQFTQMRSVTVGFETALNALDHAVLGVDRRGQVIFVNAHAECILRNHGGLSVVNGRLNACMPELNRQLETLLGNAVATGAGRGALSGGSVLIMRKSGKSPLRVTVTPMSASFAGRSAQVAALVFISDPAKKVSSRGETLRALYGLTPAEARVADLLVQGLDVREVAEKLGMTLETGRFHVKRILSKAGVRRQTELMRLMLSLPADSDLRTGSDRA